MLHLLVAGLVATVVIVESADVCPTDPPGTVYACIYMPKCFADGTCGAGQRCCPHICGAHCVTIVHCDPIDCGSVTCTYGFQPDSRGCKTCTCRTSKPCTTKAAKKHMLISSSDMTKQIFRARNSHERT